LDQAREARRIRLHQLSQLLGAPRSTPARRIGRCWDTSLRGDDSWPTTLRDDSRNERFDALVAFAERLLSTARIRATPPTALPGNQQIGRTSGDGRRFFGHRITSKNRTTAGWAHGLDEPHLDQDRERAPSSSSTNLRISAPPVPKRIANISERSWISERSKCAGQVPRLRRGQRALQPLEIRRAG